MFNRSSQIWKIPGKLLPIHRILGTLYYAVDIPLHLGFIVNPNETVDSTIEIISVSLLVSYAVDLLFLVNSFDRHRPKRQVIKPLMEHFHGATEPVKPETKWERRLSYAALLPLDLLILPLAPQRQRMWIYIFRLNKVLRIFHLPNFLERNGWKLRQSGARRLIRSFLSLITLSHWTACLIALETHVSCGFDLSFCTQDTSWAVADQQRSASWIRRYVRTVYFTMVALVTTGFGDIAPYRLVETVLMSFVMLVGMCVSTSIIASFSYEFSTMNTTTVQLNRRVDNMQWYMRVHKLPLTLRHGIDSFFAYCQAAESIMNENSIVESLPQHLRSDVALCLKGGMMARLRIFSEFPSEFLKAITMRVTTVVYSPQDTIVSHDSIVTSMYILATGNVAKLAPGKKSNDWQYQRRATQRIMASRRGEYLQGILCEGSSFCEFGILFDEDEMDGKSVPKAQCHIAITFCTVIVLTRSTFLETIQKFYSATWEDHIERMRSIVMDNSRTNSQSSMYSVDGISSQAFSSHSSKVPWAYPHSDFRLVWNIFAFIFTLIQTVEIPVQVGLSDKVYGGTFAGLFFFDRICDLFFLVDFILHGGWFIDTNAIQYEVVTSAKTIWTAYISTWRFAVDFFATFPWELLFSLFMNESEAIFCRLVRLVRCFILTIYFLDVRIVSQRLGMPIGSSTSTLCALAYTMALLVHWGGCLWYFLGAPRHGYAFSKHLQSTMLDKPIFSECLAYAAGSPDTVCTWMSLDGIANDETSLWTKYLRATYSALLTTTTVGYGDIRPCTTTETLFAYVWVFASSIFYYAAIGAGAAAISEIRRLRNNFDMRNSSLNAYLFHHKIPRRLRSQVHQFSSYQWERHRGVEDSQLVSFLPQQLRQSIVAHRYTSLLNKTELFGSEASKEALGSVRDNILWSLISSFKRQVWLEGQIIARSGEPCDRMFIVQHGRVEAIHPRSHIPLQAMEESMSYGDFGLFDATTKRLTVHLRASTFCEVLLLSRKDIVNIERNFPQEYHALHQLAETRREFEHSVKHNLEKYAKLGDHIDIKSLYVARAVHSSVFLPDSTYRKIWNVVILGIIVYQLWAVPYKLAFSSRDTSLNLHLQLIEIALDLLLVKDAYMRKNRFACVRDGHVVTDPSRIEKYYRDEQLQVDILWLLPLPLLHTIVYMIFPTQTILQWGPWCYIPRFCGFHRLKSLFVATTGYAIMYWGSLNVNYFKLIRIIFILGTVSHYCGCFFYGFAEYSLPCDGDCQSHAVGFSHTSGNWITEDSIAGDSAAPAFHRWVRSFYWALSTLTVVCYGDITPTNPSETIIVFVVVLVGVGVLSSLVGDMANIVISLNEAKAALERKVNAFTQYANLKQLSTELRTRVLAYYEYVLEGTDGLDEECILANLPYSLKVQLARQLLQPFIMRIPELTLTHEVDDIDGILGVLAQTLTSQLCLPGEMIVRENKIGGALYILKDGKTEVYCEHKARGCPRQTVTLNILDGSTNRLSCRNCVFGEAAFFDQSLAQYASVRSIGYSEILSLSYDDWASVSPGTAHDERIKQFAAELFEKQMQARESICCNIERMYNGHPDKSDLRLKLTEKMNNSSMFNTLSRCLSRFGARQNLNSSFYRKLLSAQCRKRSRQVRGTGRSPLYRRLMAMKQVYDTTRAHELPSWEFTYPNVRYIAHPDSAFRIRWQCAFFAAILYNQLMIPFRVAFQDSDSSDDLSSWILWWTATDIVADLVFYADVVLNACVFTFRTKGEICCSTRTIFRRYLSNRGRYDLLILLPLDRCFPTSMSWPHWRTNKVSSCCLLM